MSGELRVLLVEDSADDAELLLDALRAAGFTPEHQRVQTLDDLQSALDQNEWQLVLLDYSLPRLAAPQALAAVRTHDLDLPLIIVSGSVSDEDAVASMRAGAHDYVLKDNLSRLPAAVERELAEAVERRERRAAEQRLHYLALHDEPTGLANRAALEAVLRDGPRDSEPELLALLVVELERIAEVRETFGARHADQLLREVAGRLASRAADARIIARLGDERLGLLVPVGISAGVGTIAEEIVGAFESPFAVRDLVLAVSCRVGTALYPGSANSAEQLIQHAEMALQLARRSQFQVGAYRDGLEHESADQLVLLGELQGAAARGELSLTYQPKVDVRSGAVRGLEALLRWQHPQRGPVSPALFIPLAERAGYVGQLTQWVVHAAVQQQRRWRRDGLELPVAINLSAQDLGERFPQFLIGVLEGWGVPPSAIACEVTESAVMRDGATALECLRRLHDAGIALSLDDFGTGHSALNYLRVLPVQELKIDRSFVVAANESERDRSILELVAQLGERLGLHVVAEGVEDAATLALLEGIGCPTAQGYFFSKPLPAAGIEAWLQRPRPARRDAA